jgi:hypothetical protein
MKKQITKAVRTAQYILLAVLMVSMTACAAHVQPGPAPAQLTVSVDAFAARNSPVKVSSYDSWRFREGRGPLWVWDVYVVREDGYYQELMPLGPGPRRWSEGETLTETVTYTIPSGRYTVRLRVTPYLEFGVYGGGGGYDLIVKPVADWEEDIVLEAKPGAKLAIERTFGK